MKKSILLLTINLVLLVSVFAQPKRLNLNDDNVLQVPLKSAGVANNFDVAIKKSRLFKLNPMVRNHSNVAVGDTLQLALFPGKEYLSVIQTKTTDVNGTTVLVARLTGFQFAFCLISISEQAVLVTVDIPELKEKYTTRFQPNKSTQYLVQLDENKLDELKDGHLSIGSNDSLRQSYLPKEFKTNSSTETNTSQNNIGLKSAQLSSTADDSAQIDILVVYTPAAKEWANTYEGGINNSISLAMANCNLVSANSKLGIKFNLVHSLEVDYSESGDSKTDLQNLTDGALPNVPEIRDILAADLVILLTTTNDLGGVAWLLYNKSGIEDYAYSVVRIQQASGLSTIHEIGHNFGANHTKEQNFEPGPTQWSNWPENTWSAGWRWKNADNNYYCTVMGYDAGWYYPDGNSTTQIPYFSDPDILFQGQSIGDVSAGNNSRTIREIKHVIAGYRETIDKNTPTVYTVDIHDITQDGVVSGGNVTNVGDAPITACGVVWSTKPIPTLNNNFTVDITGTGYFTSHIGNLTLNKVYYLRAYATNSFGTTYGNQVGFIYHGGLNHDFVTLWKLPEGQDKLEMALGTSGEVPYKWETVPAEQNGAGIFPKVYGVVRITDLPAGKTIRISMAPQNLKRFFTLSPCNPKIDIVDKENLIDMEQWGTAKWNNMRFAFSGCKNLNISATDFPDLFSVRNMGYMFNFCNALTGPTNISDWFVGYVKNMDAMFCFATKFNQDISGWDVSNVKVMNAMFQGSWAFNQNISKWNVSRVNTMEQMFNDARDFNQDIGKWDVSKATSMSAMFMSDSSFNQYIGDWNVSNVTNMQSMFAYAPYFNQDIGSWDVSNVTTMSQMFLSANSFNQDIAHWNVSNVEDMSSMFNLDTAFNQNIGDWDVSKVTNMNYMFEFTKNFDQDISSWNVSQVTEMEAMFYNAKSFNQKIGDWNVSNVTNMNKMFYAARKFNQDISGWNVAKVNNMSGMFSGATSFNHDIRNWNVSSVTNMSSMFCYTDSFNQDLSRWNVSNVTSMNEMFLGSATFNQNIGSWNVSSVEDMGRLFFNATSFNQDISNWKTSNTTNMWQMFYNARAFNQNIGNWDVSKVKNMSGMFSQTRDFNQDISDWDVSTVENMSSMFEYASAFNQNIENWDVSKVTDMSGMFFYSTAFNQSIGNWNLSGVPNMSNMLFYCGMNSKNYSATLNGWSSNVYSPDSLTLGADGLNYDCNAVEARNYLTTTKGWTINGDAKSFFNSNGSISGEKTLCQNQKSVTYTLPDIENATSYLWTLPTGTTGTSTTNKITVDLDANAVSGDITVRGINSCGESEISKLPITVYPTPQTPSISLTDNVLHSNAANGNQWYYQNAPLTNAVSKEYTAKTDGAYYVVVNQQGCSSEPSNTINVTVTGIETMDVENKIKVYPNPVSNELTIEFEGNTAKIGFEIINAIGQTVYSGNTVNQTTVQTGSFAPGTYLVKIENRGAFEFSKVIKK
jgi:surface protein